MARFSLCFLLLFMVAVVMVAEGAPPPKKPKKVKCQDRNFRQCFHKDLFCPDSCPRTCEVNCATCEPVCTPTPPPPPPPPPKARKPRRGSPPPPPPPQANPSPSPNTSPSPITHSPPPPPPPPPSSPPPPQANPSPSPNTSPSPVTQSPPPPPPPPPSSPPPPQANPSPSPITSTPPPAVIVKCKNRNFPHCFSMQQSCPSACPGQCEVDCVTCSPVCNCNRPGAVCQDPRFIGGDGITFYFHGKKDRDFCLVSDPNLHINGHFIGRRNNNMKRDFTWVQSIAILFDTHKLFIGAQKTSQWDDSIDRLSLSFDAQPILLPDGEGTKWQSDDSPRLSITRSRDTNAVEIELRNVLKIKATVVPITEKDSRVHNYGVTGEDCFAHLDLSFKFQALSGDVHGVLGQTYGRNYVSRVKMGVEMPVLGGDIEFRSSNIFAVDCAVSRFSGGDGDNKPVVVGSSSLESFEFADMNCASGIDGRGVVCKR